MPLVHVRRVSKNLFQMVNIEDKNVTVKELKVNKSKHIQINLLLYMVLNSSFPEVPFYAP